MARPRDPAIDDRVLEAVAALFAEGGYEAVTVAAVARRSGVSRPSIYRRWPTRVQLVFEASTRAGVPTTVPDTGSLLEDLRLAVRGMAEVMAATPRNLLSEQMGLMIADEGFARSVVDNRLDPDRDLVLAAWDRAVERGEVRGEVDGRAVLDALIGACLYRIVVCHDPVDDRIDGLVEVALRGCLTAEAEASAGPRHGA